MDFLATKKPLLYGIILPFRIAPICAIIKFLCAMLNALVPFAQIFAFSAFVNTAIHLFQSGAALSAITKPLAIVALLMVWNLLSEGLLKFVDARFAIRLREAMHDAFIEKRSKLLYQHIENQESWDTIHRVCEKKPIEERLHLIYEALLRTLALVIEIVSVLTILVTQLWWAGLLIIALSLALMWLSLKAGKQSYDAGKEVADLERKYEYIAQTLTQREGAAERALFGYTSALNTMYSSAYDKAYEIEHKVRKKWFVRMKSGGIIGEVLSMLILLCILPPLLGGLLSVGMFIALANALFTIIQSMTWQLSELTQSLAQGKEFMKDMQGFFALEEEAGIGDGAKAAALDFESLEFRNVSFCYPASSKAILDKCSFTMTKGKCYAFVGLNGAGKTTITKLLLGLYKAYTGEILLNGKELSLYTQTQIQSVFGCIFQDYAKYSISVRDNIAIGNLLHCDRAKIERAIELAELAPILNRLPEGLDTPLGKIKENGTELSGGQWQRIAIARSIVNEAPVLILDEPTASLDPIAESDVYARYEEISKGKTTIFISHRLGSTKLAERILVLEDGAIAEAGMHGELMDIKGSYWAMYEDQKGWYA